MCHFDVSVKINELDWCKGKWLHYKQNWNLISLSICEISALLLLINRYWINENCSCMRNFHDHQHRKSKQSRRFYLSSTKPAIQLGFLCPWWWQKVLKHLFTHQWQSSKSFTMLTFFRSFQLNLNTTLSQLKSEIKPTKNQHNANIQIVKSH